MKKEDDIIQASAAGNILTFAFLVDVISATDVGDTLELGWGLYSLKSHSFHKARLNIAAIDMRKEFDALGVLSRLWADIRWETSFDFPRGKIEIYKTNELKGEINKLVAEINDLYGG